MDHILICCVCLGDNSEDADEIIQCDNCGITVHEGNFALLFLLLEMADQNWVMKVMKVKSTPLYLYYSNIFLYCFFSKSLLLFTLLHLFPRFSPSPPSSSPTFFPPQGNLHIVVHVLGLCINALWWIPSPSFILSILFSSCQCVLCTNLLLLFCSLVYVHQIPHISGIMWCFSFRWLP